MGSPKNSWTAFLDKAREEKMRWIITKTNNWQNFQLLTFSYQKNEFFQVHGQIDLLQIFQLSVFVFSREKCH